MNFYFNLEQAIIDFDLYNEFFEGYRNFVVNNDITGDVICETKDIFNAVKVNWIKEGF